MRSTSGRLPAIRLLGRPYYGCSAGVIQGQGYRKVTQMRSTHAKLLAGALTLGAVVPAAGTAQAGFDPTYGVGGIATVAMSATSGDRFLGSTPGPGGTTYAVGFTTVPGSPDQLLALAKLRSDGSRDAEFGVNGVASINVRPGPFAQPPANADAHVPGDADRHAGDRPRRRSCSPTARSSSPARPRPGRGGAARQPRHRRLRRALQRRRHARHDLRRGQLARHRRSRASSGST